MKNILAIDLGTKCGWAITPQRSGTWDLTPSTFDSKGMRFVKFQKHLEIALQGIDFVVYEEVRMHNGVHAAHVYGGLMAILQAECEKKGIHYAGVGVGTLKKFATGKGNAKKDKMILAANRMFPAINIKDDNHADALCILKYAYDKYIDPKNSF